MQAVPVVGIELPRARGVELSEDRQARLPIAGGLEGLQPLPRALGDLRVGLRRARAAVRQPARVHHRAAHQHWRLTSAQHVLNRVQGVTVEAPRSVLLVRVAYVEQMVPHAPTLRFGGLGRPYLQAAVDLHGVD